MQSGETLGGRFQIERHAGSGAMGVVYRALDLATRGPVAIKLMARVAPVAAARFEREIAMLSRLRHPGIVAYVGHGSTATGAPFLAMEWLDGETLAERMVRAPLAWREVLEIGSQVAAALVVAHAHGVVHRDLKPSNVLLSPSGAKLVDFGVARAAGPPLTATGEMIGTPAFMSPEQALGERELDARSDLFSLGSMLYQCISGVNPFDADSAVKMLLRLTTERAAPLMSVAPTAPPALAHVVDQLLEPAPERRPASASAVVSALASVCATMPERTKAEIPAARARVTARGGAAVAAQPLPATKPRRALALGVVGVAVVSIAAALVWTFAIGPLASKSRTPKRVTGERCPNGAIACAEIDVPDLSAVDPFDAVPQAVALARTSRSGAEFMGFLAREMGPKGVDLAGGGAILVDLSADLHVEAQGSLLILVDGALNNDQATAKPLKLDASCGPLQAYRVAVERGIADGGAIEIALIRKPKGLGQYSVIAANSGIQVEMVIEYPSCKK